MKTWLILTQPKHYAYALYLGVFALVLLSLALTILLTFLGIHSPMLILLGCMITVAVTIFLAIQLGFLVQEAQSAFYRGSTASALCDRYPAVFALLH